jgi:23S rRNA pseudouridine1911/1915/1917 synthase
MPQPTKVAEPTELLPFLFTAYADVKRTKVRQWLKFGGILVNGVPTTRFNTALQPGDVISVRTEKAAREENLLPPGMKIIHEDPEIIIIHKPENLLTIASEAEREETAYAYLTDYVKRGRRDTRDRIWIVHRLDRETSGLMVFARTSDTKEALQTGWDQAEKCYLAVVEGLMSDNEGTLHSFLDENSPYKVYPGPQSERTREAITHYRVLKRAFNRSLVSLTLETGRRHQIRVQLAAIGHPIIGDEKYEAQTDPAKRLGLHSHTLKFTHPVTSAPMSFESPLPLELVRLV